MKNLLEGINSIFKDTEEMNSDLEEKVVEKLQDEHQKVKQIFKNEASLRNLWDNIKEIIFLIIWFQKEKRKGQKACLKK